MCSFERYVCRDRHTCVPLCTKNLWTETATETAKSRSLGNRNREQEGNRLFIVYFESFDFLLTCTCINIQNDKESSNC